MKKSQLVFVPVPGIGHLVSVVGFAKLILERDDSFLISMLVINNPYAPSISNYVESLAAIHTQINFITIPEKVVEAPPLEVFVGRPESTFTQFLREHNPFIKDAIVNQVMANSPVPIASVIVDLFCVSFIDVAKELGVPSHVFFCSDAAFYGLMLYLSESEDKGEPKFRETDPHYIIPYYANPVPYRVLPLLHRDTAYETFAWLGRKYKESNGIIINTFSELESHAVRALVTRDDLPPTFTVGPIIDHKGKSLTGSEAAKCEEITKWLDDQPEKSVVFLCFGSQGAMREAQLKEIAIGLERSGHRFLWAVRKPPGPGEGLPGFYTSYDEILPEEFLEKTKNIGMLCGWAPQVQVLAHKAVGAFVSHCGWNSTLEALWSGVPIITWPCYGEQHINAFQLVKDLGLAVELTLDFRKDSPTDFVKAEDITKAVKYVMEEGSEYRNRAEAASEMGRRALLEGGSSDVAFGRLIEQWLRNKP
ncbi:unnamed protein product [Dovyalis caffra]|uniref:Glycosyltransferase n=1 Tax=Dovyalis caffra TaxID=77055 RepID=A0AAV1SQ44_9ROSI|nr:unnamed protein product [Dovyalis caffra]